MGKHAGAFKSEKRKKELVRQKKQEEKRQKRVKRDAEAEQGTEVNPESSTPEAQVEDPQ